MASLEPVTPQKLTSSSSPVEPMETVEESQCEQHSEHKRIPGAAGDTMEGIKEQGEDTPDMREEGAAKSNKNIGSITETDTGLEDISSSSLESTTPKITPPPSMMAILSGRCSLSYQWLSMVVTAMTEAIQPNPNMRGLLHAVCRDNSTLNSALVSTLLVSYISQLTVETYCFAGSRCLFKQPHSVIYHCYQYDEEMAQKV